MVEIDRVSIQIDNEIMEKYSKEQELRQLNSQNFQDRQIKGAPRKTPSTKEGNQKINNY